MRVKKRRFSPFVPIERAKSRRAASNWHRAPNPSACDDDGFAQAHFTFQFYFLSSHFESLPYRGIFDILHQIIEKKILSLPYF